MKSEGDQVAEIRKLVADAQEKLDQAAFALETLDERVRAEPAADGS